MCTGAQWLNTLADSATRKHSSATDCSIDVSKVRRKGCAGVAPSFCSRLRRFSGSFVTYFGCRQAVNTRDTSRPRKRDNKPSARHTMDMMCASSEAYTPKTPRSKGNCMGPQFKDTKPIARAHRKALDQKHQKAPKSRHTTPGRRSQRDAPRSVGGERSGLFKSPGNVAGRNETNCWRHATVDFGNSLFCQAFK